MSGLRRLRVAELHPNLLCILCGGYYVDATTIVECLHSFCKTCIVRYLESSKFCPICDVQVHKTKPLLSIRPDKTLQDIVYKLVPGLYQNEMCRRREFYSGHPEIQPVSQEDGGSDVGRWYILPDDPVSLALYPAPPILTQTLPTHTTNHSCPAENTNVTRGDSMPRLSEITKVRGSHVRYLQCPAGVSVAQLKRLLRAKFGVGPSHPMSLLTCSSDDPLNDTLTLVDVAYITSWQRTEPLQLLYRIYERASKKIKLDPDTLSKDTNSLSEDMPKLEPNVGTDVSSVMCSSLESAGSLSDYRSAPLLQAVGVLGYHISLKNEQSSAATVSASIDTGPETVAQSENSEHIVGVIQEETKQMEMSSCEKENPSHESSDSVSELKQGSSDRSESNVREGQSALCAGDVGRSSVATYTPSFTAPSNGVNVGIAFIPGEMRCVAPATVPCAIIPSENCIPVTENCISVSVEGPAISNIAAQTHTNGGLGLTSANSWSDRGLKKESRGAGTSDKVVPKENKGESESRKANEEEGKEVQLKISETGVMSVCGQDTTVEGVINSLQTEACELLSKIESGSIGEDFPAKDVRLQKASDSNGENKKVKLKEAQKVVSEECSKDNERVTADSIGDKGEKRISISTDAAPALNHKPTSMVNKDGKEMKTCEKPSVDAGGKVNQEKMADKRSLESRKSVDQQQLSNNLKESSGNGKDGRSSHIPASLTAASLANLNKPHLKAGTSKTPAEEDAKSKEKPSNNGLNPKKEGKDQVAKIPGGGCRKSSQPYGYKTLKTPPKSWNPTISRELLVAGKSSIKGNHEAPRTNKFFKARNAPRFLGNPSTGVRSMYSGTSENSSAKRTVAPKLDPKPSGPATVTTSSEPSPSNIQGMNAYVSSVQPPISIVSPATASAVVNTTPTTSHQVVTCTAQASSCTVVAGSQNISSEANSVVSRASCTLPVSLASGTKESTNHSSKVCLNTNSMAEKKSDSKSSQHSKTVTNYRTTTTVASGNKNENKTLLTTQSSSKSAVSVESTITKTDTKVSSSSAVHTMWATMPQTITSAPVMVHQKAGGSTSATTCITQANPATVSSISIPTAVQQPQQQLALAAPAVGVGIIPSCGVTFPAAIGNLPLPCHTNSSISYPTYPYMYQGTEPISLIPPHPSAPFIPTFPTCLPHRPALGPRNMGTKIMPELSLQPNILPMVPLVPQVPPQAISPRPMTPPSPRTPTSSQSPRPYPAQSPRQSTTNHSRPVTPQSPKQNQLSKPENQPTKTSGTPPLAGSQSVKLGGTHIQGAQTLWPSGCHKQVIAPGQFSSQPSPQSPGPPPTFTSVNTSLRLNASVQTSSSHTLTTPRTQWSSVNSKPIVPQSSKSPVVSVPGLSNTHGGQTDVLETNRPHTPQSPKSPRPNTPQSPRLSSSAQCPGPQGVGKLSTAAESPRPHTPHSRSLTSLPRLPSQSKNSGSKKTHISEMSGSKHSDATVSEAGVSCGPNPPVITPSITFAPPGTNVSSGSLTPTITSSLGNKFILPQGAQVALPLQASFTSLYLEGVTNTLPITLSNPGISADLSSAALSPSCNTSLLIPSSNISSSMPFIPFSNSAQLPLPVCTAASISQPLCAVNTTVTPNISLLNTKMSAFPLNNTQIPKQSGSSRMSANNLSNISSAVPVQSIGSFVGAAPSGNSVTMSTPSGTCLPLPCSTVCTPPAVPRTASPASTTTTMSASTSEIVTTACSISAAITVPAVAPAAVSVSASASLVESQPTTYQSTITLPTNVTSPAADTSITGGGTSARVSTHLSAGPTRTTLPETIATTSIGSTTASVELGKPQSVSTTIDRIQPKRPSNIELLSVSTATSQTFLTGSSNAEKLSTNVATSASELSSKSVVKKSVTTVYTQASQALQSSSATESHPAATTSLATVPAQASTSVASNSSVSMTLPKDNSQAVMNSPDIPPSGDKAVSNSSTPVSSTAIASGPQSIECFNPCGTAAAGKTVVCVKEKGGIEPQLSACTSVCDVTHVIDAKQQCAEQGVSSSGGPRPCLKS